MADLNLPYDIANNTDADAVEVEQNFNAVEAHINSSMIRADGVVAMTGQLQLVGDPVSDDDAARKAYVDNIIPIGVMMPYTGTAAPASGQWALCNGVSLSTTAYPDAFAVLGYKYGGGGGSFSLPNTSGRFLVGASGVAPFVALGETGGSADATVAAHVHGLNSHTHGMNSHTHQLPDHTHDNNHGHSDTIAIAKSDNSLNIYDLKSIVTDGGWPTTGAAGLRYGDPTSGGGADPADLSRLTGSSSLWTPGRLDLTISGSVSDYTGDTGQVVGTNPQTGAPSTANTQAASGNTASAGDSATNANLPPYVVVNYIIRIL